ncbi:hypothetical protein [Paenibacillus apis]|uniref:Uncharacterized protein n=1 Tax=Paenibacillus apis TaxID=1792174 RepID=A0A919XYP0_9BACL|nr:hypothetical protein [Paenibacillus apis]GIO41751.1 hypothetical protein J41TS4_15090 [Paenibacillus apis]
MELDYTPARKRIGEHATDFVFKDKERKTFILRHWEMLLFTLLNSLIRGKI